MRCADTTLIFLKTATETLEQGIGDPCSQIRLASSECLEDLNTNLTMIQSGTNDLTERQKQLTNGLNPKHEEAYPKSTRREMRECLRRLSQFDFSKTKASAMRAHSSFLDQIGETIAELQTTVRQILKVPEQKLLFS